MSRISAVNWAATLHFSFLPTCWNPRLHARFQYRASAAAVRSHLGCSLVAQIAVFLQRLGDDPFQFGGRSGFSRTGGDWSPVQNRLEDHSRTLATKWQGAGRHLVKHRTEGKQVGSRVQFLGSHLLRRHVGHGAQRGPGAGQVFLGERRGRLSVLPQLSGSRNC